MLEEITQHVGNYSVAVFGISNGPSGEILRLCGSGTLVATSSAHYLLTAAHVWQALKPHQWMALTLKAEVFHCFRVSTDIIHPVMIGPEQPEEWGPDLGFLRIPSELVGTILVHRTFYNLAKRREAALTAKPEIDLGIWILMGTPAEVGTFNRNQADLAFGGWVSTIRDGRQRNGFDYLDVGVKMSLPGVPARFGGLSGGGLWQVVIARSATSGEFSWNEHVSLEGVAFYESPPVDGRRIIRCHGRRSIYESMPDCENAG